MKFFHLLACFSIILLGLVNLSTNAQADFAQTPQAPQALNFPATKDESYNWAGYVSVDAGVYTAISGTWTVPTPTDNDYNSDAAWVGIGGVTSDDLIQAGTLNSNGVTESWYETLPDVITPLPLRISPGDKVSVSLDWLSGNVWKLDFRNDTTNKDYSTSIYYASSFSSAEWVEEMPSSNLGLMPLDDFGAVEFTSATTVENGNTVTIDQSGAQPMDMVNPQGQVLARASTINPDGTSFTVSRTNAQALAQTQSRSRRKRLNNQQNFWQFIFSFQ
ncbi:MAG TPA: G1 family glutamic endopeptidase [Patescibacteria group bacterium]|nr:G1 family glutamic endopeptidase [Patescibacteria group bacterium]